jgi:DNA-binding response OmpR family regulator
MPAMNESGAAYRPCLVVALGDPAVAIDACRRFRRQGWDVYQTHGGPEARRLVRMLEPELVVLGVDLEGESGFLTCAKLKRERPDGKVILVSEDAGPRNCGMAVFVGASALVRPQDCAALLANPASHAPVHAAG